MAQIENEEIKKILAEVADRILDGNWEKIEELFELIPETIDKNLLAEKYFCKARYFLDKENNSTKAIYYLNLIKKEWNDGTIR